MAKTKEITFMCEGAGINPTRESKIQIVANLTNDDLSSLINSIPKEEIFNHLPDSVFEEWAEENGFEKVAP